MSAGRLLCYVVFFSFSWFIEARDNASWNEWQVANPSQLDSLSNQTITLIRRTSTREVWVASTNGIFVFDGWDTVTKNIEWRSNPNIPIKRVVDIVKSLDGTVFLFSVEDGVFTLPPGGQRFDLLGAENAPSSLKGIESVAISKEEQTALIIAGARLYSLSLGSSKLNEVPLNIDLSNKSPKAVLSDDDGRMYAIFDEMVVRLLWQIDRYTPSNHLRCSLKVPSAASYAAIGHGKFYIADRFGDLHLIRLEHGECSRLTLPKSIALSLLDARVNAVSFLGESGLLAISTDQGLLLADDEGVNVLSVENSRLRSNEITFVEELSTGNILIGSFRGMVQATRAASIFVSKLPGELSPTITAIDSSEDALNTYVASYKRLYRANENPSGISFEVFDIGVDYVGISAIAVVESGVWIGLQSGQILYCGLTKHLDGCSATREASLAKSPITSFNKKTGSNSVIATTLEGKLFRLSLPSKRDRSLAKTLLASIKPGLLAIKITKDTCLFFKLDGAWVSPLDYSGGHENLMDELDTELSFITDAWTMGQNGDNLYLASPTGRLSVFYAKELRRISNLTSARTLLVPETIFAVEIDHLNRPWVATKSGLWLSHDMKTFGLEIPTAGFDAVSLDYGASHRNTKGDLYFGGTGGLVIVRDPSKHPRQISSKATITEVRIENTIIKSESDSSLRAALVNLNTSTRRIAFELGVEDVLPPRMPIFQHKLEGFDQSWQNTGSNNLVTYNNLPAGKYIFKARAADSTGVWSENEISLPVKVNPPNWQTWWAVVAYAVFFIAVFFYLKRANDRSVVNRARLQLAEEGAAAFARLEDDYQEQREANEALLRSRAPAARRLLGAIEASLAAQPQDGEPSEESAGLLAKLQTLDSLQSLTTRTSSHETTNIHALTNEIAAQLAQSNPMAANAIVSNEVTQEEIPLEHAIYLCLVIQEALTLATTARTYEPAVDPIVLINLEPPTQGELGEFTYRLQCDDTGLPDDGSHILERHLPLTFHLIESGGGDIAQTYDVGNELVIELVLPAINADFL